MPRRKVADMKEIQRTLTEVMRNPESKPTEIIRACDILARLLKFLEESSSEKFSLTILDDIGDG